MRTAFWLVNTIHPYCDELRHERRDNSARVWRLDARRGHLDDLGARPPRALA